MGVQNEKDIEAFLKPHCAVSGDGTPDHPRYVRLRAGRAKRSAESLLRHPADPGEALQGQDPKKVAALVWERFARVPTRESAWLEVMDRKSRDLLDTLSLGSPPKRDDGDGVSEPAALDDFESMNPAQLMALNITSMLSQLQMTDTKVRSWEERYFDLALKYVEVSTKGAADAALLDYVQQAGIAQGDDYAEAIKALVPMLPSVLDALTRKKPAAEGEPEDPAAVLPRLVDELDAHWQAHPDVVIGDLVTLGKLHAIGTAIGERLKGGA